MHIAIVTDAWLPQINGVVTTLTRTAAELEALGHEVTFISPQGLRSIPCPTYPEIRLALRPGRHVHKRLDDSQPDAIHIATEGPLGLAARRYCLRQGLRFTTAYHTRFPEYVRLRLPLPLALGYAFVRWFHRPATRTLVTTPSMRHDLKARGLTHLELWSRGVDTALFRPYGKGVLNLPRPIHLYVGRVAVEKNLDAFLSLDLPGSKVVIGDGPDMQRMRNTYPEAHYTGYLTGEPLARHLADADVFVFPSRTDTFGLVLLEAMACGVPVAAFPVPGPRDLINNHFNGYLDEDLGQAIKQARTVSPEHCRNFALGYSWGQAARQFLSHLVPARVVASQGEGLPSSP